MKTTIIVASLLILVGCGNNGLTITTPPPPRFEVVSTTDIPYTGKIVVVRDNVLGSCMANFVSNGVMSWQTPCDQAHLDKVIQEQMQQLMVPQGTIATDGDYTPLQPDSTGRLWVVPQ